MNDQRYYEIVAGELQRKSLRPGLWVRAVAETGGEGDTARAVYIRLRVSELFQIEQAGRAREAADAERRAAEEACAQAQQREAETRVREEENRCRIQEEAAERLRIGADPAEDTRLGILILGVCLVVILLLAVVWAAAP